MQELHTSLYPHLAQELEKPLPAPVSALFDHHMHAGDVASSRAYIDAARAYGVTKALALTTSMEGARELDAAYPGFFLFCGWPYLFDIDENRNWQRERLAEIEAQGRAGFAALKFRMVPDREGRKPFVWLDDARVKPLFDLAEDLGLVVQAHVSQPNAWFEKYYTAERAGRKEDYFRQVEHILAAHPRMVYVGVHMGGYPEDLGYLQQLMDNYPNFNIDTSATKWAIRELSRRHDEAREFFIRNADRILFGTDLVVQKSISPTYYTSRFHVQRTMWETSEKTPSMIKDPDSETPPAIHGLGLPTETLRKIYWGNAKRMFGLGG